MREATPAEDSVLMSRGRYNRLLWLTAVIGASPALAGPPYEADDPVPTELHHWEIYAFATGSGQQRFDDITTGLDLNYGAAADLQLTATLPADFVRDGQDWTSGIGDVEIGAKYRLIHTGEKGFQLAFFPRVILPTSSLSGASDEVRALLPVWMQKDFDNWSIFGGGGYMINPGKGNRDNFRASVAVTKAIGTGLVVGAEASWEGADTVVGHPTTSLGLGSTVHLGGPVSLLLRGGPRFSAGKTGFHAFSALGFAF